MGNPREGAPGKPEQPKIVTCPKCGGSGKDKDGDECTKCEGRGKVEDD
jgi:DnaJ-class molecular chaperone